MEDIYEEKRDWSKMETLLEKVQKNQEALHFTTEVYEENGEFKYHFNGLKKIYYENFNKQFNAFVVATWHCGLHFMDFYLETQTDAQWCVEMYEKIYIKERTYSVKVLLSGKDLRDSCNRFMDHLLSIVSRVETMQKIIALPPDAAVNNTNLISNV